MSSHASSSAPATTNGRPRERQTRLQEHLRTVKSSRGISPGSGTKPLSSRQQTQASPVESIASGRPKRKAAARVKMQEVEIDSDEDEEVDGADGAEEDEQEEEEELQTRRGGRRAAPTPKKVRSVEELAPTASRASTSSSARKSPAKARASPRQREISNVSIDVEGMNEVEVQQRLTKEKEELMARLAQHGINPQAEVLDRALHEMSSKNEKLTVQSFLRTLSSLNATSPARRGLPLAPLALQVSPPSQQKRVSFSTLESPSTPSTSDRPAFELPSPPQPSFLGAPVALLPVTLPVPPAQKPSLLPSPTGFNHHAASFAPQQQQQQQHYPNPASIRANRLASFANRSHSAPVVPQLPNFAQPHPELPTPPAQAGAGSLMATSVNGMGRVALSRRSLFGAPASSAGGPSSPSSLLPAFAFSAASASKQSAPSSSSSLASKRPPPADDRLRKLQSWLDDDEDDVPEDASSGKAGNLDAAAEMTLKVAASKLDQSLSASLLGGAAAMKLVDAPASDEEVETEVRVGGKNIHVLRKSVKRQRDEVEAVETPTAPTTRSAASKGKQKAEDVVVGEPERPSTPPPLSAKRVRIGTNSTPVLDVEPTFVTVPFSPEMRRNNDFSDLGHEALAPSFAHSPVRGFATVSAVAPPSSPLSAKLPIPMTPRYGESATGDYLPDSPARSRRSRMVSNGGGLFSELLSSGGWADSAFDEAASGTDWLNAPPSSSSHALPWNSEIHSTPSRALSSSATAVHATPGSAAATTSALFSTPYGSSSHLRRPSDFLAALDSPSSHHLHQQPHSAHSAPPLSSRLFATADDLASSPFHAYSALPTASPSFRPVSPLNPRRGLPLGQTQHRRTPSSSLSGGGSATMQVSQSMPGMRQASHLGGHLMQQQHAQTSLVQQSPFGGMLEDLPF
ncbi:hypothetical protein JCM8547_004014 [Rhodosporidiobolus lusitaniae]